MRISDLEKKLNIDALSPEDYTKEDLASQIGLMITQLRIINGLTQEELAEKVGTKQPSIARLENGNSLPSLKFLYEIAQAVDTYLIPPEFDSVKNYNSTADFTSITYTEETAITQLKPEDFQPSYEIIDAIPTEGYNDSQFNFNKL